MAEEEEEEGGYLGGAEEDERFAVTVRSRLPANVAVAARSESPSSACLTPVVATVFCASPRRRRERRCLTTSWTPAPVPLGGATRSRSRARGEVGEKRRPLVCIGYRPDTGVNEKTSVKLTAQKRHAKHQRQAHPFLFYRGIFYRCIGP